ncbi:MAG: hypothetical protein V5A79_04315 [Candidatus Bipolaricaulota bacterium]|nr:hypothetical protein [Candidatus Bipolaricaulota bacterium]
MSGVNVLNYGGFSGCLAREELGSINFSEVFPVKYILLAGILVGEALFFTLGNSYTFGLWYGLVVSLLMQGLMVNWSTDLVKNRDGGSKIAWRVSLLALVRFMVYGLALAFTFLTGWLNFYAAAGGLVLPTFTVRLYEGFKK